MGLLFAGFMKTFLPYLQVGVAAIKYACIREGNVRIASLSDCRLSVLTQVLALNKSLQTKVRKYKPNRHLSERNV